ncbi:phage tail assembly protein [Phenylobacterium sp.]|uniref:phage tail assembly protein n=1 Tax=Phenylobacterium sp. TaxID=1871053 RepID=UPI0035B26266
MALTQAQLDALPDTLDVPLRKPLEQPDGSLLERLSLREPTAGEIEAFAAKASGIFAVSLISGVPEQVVRQLPAREFKKAEAYLLGFMEDALPTGPAS